MSMSNQRRFFFAAILVLLAFAVIRAWIVLSQTDASFLVQKMEPKSDETENYDYSLGKPSYDQSLGQRGDTSTSYVPNVSTSYIPNSDLNPVKQGE